MAQYLLQVAYTSEAWANMVKHPQDRISIVSKVIQTLGGKMIGGWLSFGEYDTVAILDMPDNISAAAFSIAAAAGGACKSLKTTPLLTTEDGMEAAKKAAKSGYVPPQGGG